jgi:alkane 1-monooxygenase
MAGNSLTEKNNKTLDGKKYLWLLALAMPFLQLLIMELGRNLSNYNLLWLSPIIVFGAFPILDGLIGEDWTNPKEDHMKRLLLDPYYPFIVRFGTILSFCLWLYSVWYVVNNHLEVHQYIALALGVGWMAIGLCVNASHELGHKTNKFDIFLAKISLLPSAMGYFRVEHNQGHHAQVATPSDPASAKYGESFWRFIIREIPGAHMRSFKIEKARLKRKGRPTLGLENEYIQTWIGTITLWFLLVVTFDTSILIYLLLVALIGNLALSSANYVEHYGLLRIKQDNGKYENCKPCHSWNSNRVLTNLMFFHLQRHSDHHAHANRPFQCLRHFDEAPQLPFGYLTMFLAAWVPPIWRQIMDKRLVAHAQGDISKVSCIQGDDAALTIRFKSIAKNLGYD